MQKYIYTLLFTREQFKRSLKSWLFECAYGRRRVWETVQSEGAPKKWTYLLTYFLNCTIPDYTQSVAQSQKLYFTRQMKRCSEIYVHQRTFGTNLLQIHLYWWAMRFSCYCSSVHSCMLDQHVSLSQWLQSATLATAAADIRLADVSDVAGCSGCRRRLHGTDIRISINARDVAAHHVHLFTTPPVKQCNMLSRGVDRQCNSRARFPPSFLSII